MHELERGEGRGPRWKLFALLGIVGILIVGFIFGFRTVDAGKTCAIVRLGEVAGVAKRGFSWVPRALNTFKCYDSRGVMYQTAPNAQGNADYMDYPITANTQDGQQVSITANVVFHVDDVEFVYRNVGTSMEEVKERVVANFTRSTIRDLAAHYEAKDLYTSGRIEFSQEIEGELTKQFAYRGVTLDSFELRSIVFDNQYVDAIEGKQIAYERIETREYESRQAVFEAERSAALAKGEADARIEQARGEAEAKVVNAKADAEAVLLAAQAEAEAIKLRGEALALYPEVLQLNFIEQLANAKWLMLPADGITPFLPLDILE